MKGNEQPSYAEIDQFALSGLDAAGVGESVLALAAADAVEVVTAENRTTVGVDAPVADVAVDNYLFVLAGGEVRALTTGGVRLWSVAVDAAERLATVDDVGVLVVVTDTELVGLDAETGGEVFRTERPYADVRGGTSVVGSGSAAAIGAWSFLVAVDGDGMVTLDEDLDSAIRDVAAFGDQFVVALKGGDLVAVGPEGDRLWESGLSVDALAPVGREWLPATSDGRCYAVDGAGQYRDLNVGTAESVVATPNGSLLVTIADGTARVHRPAADIEPALTAALDATEVVPGDPLAITLINDAAVPIETTVTPSGTGVDFESGDHRVELPPDSEREVSFGTTGADDEEVTVRVEGDGRTLLDRTLPVEEPAAGGEAVEVETGDLAVVNGVVRADVTLVNRGDRRLEDVTVASAKTSVPGLNPGERVTVPVEQPVEFGEQHVTAVERSGETIAPVEVETGDPPTVTVERTGEVTSAFVDVGVESAAAAPVTDTLRVDVDGGPTVERSVSFDPGERLLVALPLARPPMDPFTMTVALPGVGVERHVELDGWDTAGYGERPTSSGGRDGSGTDEPPRGGRTDAGAGWEDIDVGSNRSAAEGLQTAGPLTDEDDTGRPELEVDRVAKNGTASERLHDQIRVQNVGTAPARDLTLTVGNRTIPIGDLSPEETVTVGRICAFYEAGDHDLPGGRVKGDIITASVDPETVAIDPVGLAVTATIRPTDEGATASFDIENHTDTPVKVGVLGLGPSGRDIEVQHEVDNQRAIAPGETGTVEWTLTANEWACPPTGTVLNAALAYESSGAEDVEYTLARVTDGDEGGVTVDIKGCERVVVGENGFVDIAVTNGGGDAISDVTLAATGEPISEMYYSPETVGRISPGETITHEVVLRPERAGTVTFDLAVKRDGGTETVAFDVSGPAASDQTEWDESLSEEWAVQRRKEGADDGLKRVVTDFEQR